MISVFDHDLSIGFCKNRTRDQSSSGVALKILCLSLTTLSSRWRHAMSSHSATSFPPLLRSAYSPGPAVFPRPGRQFPSCTVGSQGQTRTHSTGLLRPTDAAWQSFGMWEPSVEAIFIGPPEQAAVATTSASTTFS